MIEFIKLVAYPISMGFEFSSVSRHGVSPLKAIAVIAIIAIIAGGTSYYLFTYGPLSQRHNIEVGVTVESANMYSSPALMAITIKNSGTAAISALNISVSGVFNGASSPLYVETPSSLGSTPPVGLNLLTSPLAPDNAVAYSFLAFPTGVSPISGNTYTIVVTSTSSNGAVSTTTYAVVAS